MYYLPGEVFLWGYHLDQNTYPAWLCVAIWAIFLLVVTFGFKDPEIKISDIQRIKTVINEKIEIAEKPKSTVEVRKLTLENDNDGDQ